MKTITMLLLGIFIFISLYAQEEEAVKSIPTIIAKNFEAQETYNFFENVNVSISRPEILGRLKEIENRIKNEYRSNQSNLFCLYSTSLKADKNNPLCEASEEVISAIGIPLLYDEMKALQLVNSLQEFHQLLLAWEKEKQVELFVCENPSEKIRTEEGILSPRGLLYYSRASYYMAVMHQADNSNGEQYYATSSWPATWIQNQWNAGKIITEVCSYGNGWVVKTNYSDAGQRYYKTNSNKNIATWIQEGWDTGYTISHIAYNRSTGYRILIMDLYDKTGKPNRNESWYYSPTTFPSTWVQNNWNAGMLITEVSGFSTGWFVVMATQSGGQAFYVISSWPKAWVQSYWDQNYSLDNVAYHSGKSCWAVIMTRYSSGKPGQGYLYSSSFPSTYIKNQWNAGYNIHDLAH